MATINYSNLYKKISINEDQIISELNSVIENNKNIIEYNLAEIDIDINNLEKKDKIISEILSSINKLVLIRLLLNSVCHRRP